MYCIYLNLGYKRGISAVINRIPLTARIKAASYCLAIRLTPKFPPSIIADWPALCHLNWLTITIILLLAKAILDSPIHLAIGLLLGDRLTLVVILLASAETDLYFAVTCFIYIYIERNECQTVCLNLACQLENLPLMHQQLAFAKWLYVEAVALLIR